MKNIKIIIALTLVLSVFTTTFGVVAYASLREALSFTSRDEFHSSAMEAIEVFEEQSMIKLFGNIDNDVGITVIDCRIEGINRYIDFTNVVDSIELDEIRVDEDGVVVDYRNKGEEPGFISLRIIWARFVRDGDAFLESEIRQIGQHRVEEINHNGNRILKTRVYWHISDFEKIHSGNHYSFVYNEHAIIVHVSAELLEHYPEETFFDVHVVYIETHPTVKLNGAVLEFDDQQPVIRRGRTLVPMRAIFEALDAEVEWDEDTHTATIVQADNEILFTIGDEMAVVNNNPVTMDVPARLINERTMIPLRFISENLGFDVDWDAETSTVLISTE